MPGAGVHPGTKGSLGIVRVPIPVDAEKRFLNDLVSPVGVLETFPYEVPHEDRDLGQEALVGEAIAILSLSHELRESMVGIAAQDRSITDREPLRLHRAVLFVQ